MRFSRAGISHCERCPLRDRKRVPGEGPEDGPIHQAFLGEAPGEQEDIKGRPFVGPSGGLLSKGLSEASTERFRCWTFNLINCRPTNNKLDSEEGREAIECCQPGFKAELAFLQDRGLRVLSALGGKSLPYLGIQTIISKARGSIYEPPKGKYLIVPAYHPSFLLHKGQQKEIPTWVADLGKAHELALKPYCKLKEDFCMFPTLADLEDFVNAAVHTRSKIGVDIETIGIRPDLSKIVVIGLASSDEKAISVPFLSRGLQPYWKADEFPEARRLVQRLFDSNPLIFQNALFDILHLRFHGFRLHATDDVLLAHHAIHPELSHRLGYIVSIYGRTPYWKDEVQLRPETIMQMDDEVLRRYNLRDAVVLHQVLEPEEQDLTIMKTTHVYRETSVPLIDVLADATSWGISLDRKALLAWGRALARKKKALVKELFSKLALPTGFNLSSGDHLRLLLYGHQSPQFIKALNKLHDYDDFTRKRPLRKDTKVYRELLESADVSENTPHLWAGPRIKTTDGGKLSTDEEAMLTLQLAALKRQGLVREFVRPDKEDRLELAILETTLWFLGRYRSYSETSKLLSTYTSFPTWSDGKVHTSFMIHGTKTGRLSSNTPDLQNIPDEARRVFKARAGHRFIEADYSNLEPRLLAYISEDTESIRIFEAGLNIHDENTGALFPGIKKTSPQWKDVRYAAKKYRLKRNYGGGLYSTYQSVCLEVPDLQITFPQFRQAAENYELAHPGETIWLKRTGDLAVKKRKLTNIFGRIRIFLGTESEIRREGVNFPIQSAAADVINPAMIKLHGLFGGWKTDQPRLLLQVHDSLLVECLTTDVKRVAKLMKKEMEQTIKIGRRSVLFPVEVKTGLNWGEMKELKV